MQRVGLQPGISWISSRSPSKHGHGGFTFLIAKFDKAIQLLLHSKVAKAELYLIGGYHNEWLELTYYIETLIPIIKEDMNKWLDYSTNQT